MTLLNQTLGNPGDTTRVEGELFLFWVLTGAYIIIPLGVPILYVYGKEHLIEIGDDDSPVCHIRCEGNKFRIVKYHHEQNEVHTLEEIVGFIQKHKIHDFAEPIK